MALVACLLSWAGSGSPTGAAPGDGSVSDPNIVYAGRWDTTSGTAATTHWSGAYPQTCATSAPSTRTRPCSRCRVTLPGDGGKEAESTVREALSV